MDVGISGSSVFCIFHADKSLTWIFCSFMDSRWKCALMFRAFTSNIPPCPTRMMKHDPSWYVSETCQISELPDIAKDVPEDLFVGFITQTPYSFTQTPYSLTWTPYSLTVKQMRTKKDLDRAEHSLCSVTSSFMTRHWFCHHIIQDTIPAAGGSQTAGKSQTVTFVTTPTTPKLMDHIPRL